MPNTDIAFCRARSAVQGPCDLIQAMQITCYQLNVYVCIETHNRCMHTHGKTFETDESAHMQGKLYKHIESIQEHGQRPRTAQELHIRPTLCWSFKRIHVSPCIGRKTRKRKLKNFIAEHALVSTLVTEDTRVHSTRILKRHRKK